MNDVWIVLGVIVATTGALALWVWVVGRIEVREQRREAERSRDGGPPALDGAPRHMRRRDRHHRDPG